MPKVKSTKLPNSNADVTAVTNSPSPPPYFQIDEMIVQRLKEEEYSLIRIPPYQLTLSIRDLLSTARKNRKNKNKSKDKIPRPQNAWVLFRKDYEANQRMRFPDKALKMKNVSIDAGKMWRKQPVKVKRYFEILSRLAHDQHKRLYPDYKYTPKKKIPTTKENTLKDWIFKDGTIKQSTNINVNASNDNASESVTSRQTDVQSHQPKQSEPPQHISTSPSLSPPSSPESLNPQTPSSTQNVHFSNFSTVTSIFTYEESSTIYNYQPLSAENETLISNIRQDPLFNLGEFKYYINNDDNIVDENWNLQPTTICDHNMIEDAFPTFSNYYSDFDANSLELQQCTPTIMPVTFTSLSAFNDDNSISDLLTESNFVGI
ncbi:9262_t:CDS:1 [Funneliformis caledonium]|uniref:9260_t:CDS:1 n=1 Tax=Funneliformis caledonium TaxID=1117310 RepID=A0A9N8YKM9_9GLOM|nr:9260_t:CDS:1 [Funneliformis caledonium]CAG8439109.1 9262_t:CDS:1 [Funneliformis caledonium]